MTALSLFLAAPALAAQTIQVSTTGTDAPGCGQGANTPCATIQGALDTSPAADGDTIQVAAGAYDETSTLNIDKDVTIIGAGDNPNSGGRRCTAPQRRSRRTAPQTTRWPTSAQRDRARRSRT